MKKNVLFYFTWQLKPVHHGIVISKLESILTRDDVGKVYYVHCEEALQPCYTNREADQSLCDICRFNNKAALAPFKHRLEILSVPEIGSEKQNFIFNSIEELKRLEYKGAKIGYGALSSYVSFTRNLDPLLNKELYKYFSKLLNAQIHVTDFLRELIQGKNIDEVYFFNGRTADTRPLYDICKKEGINFTSLELIKKSEEQFYVNEFLNCLPHDIEFHHKRMIELWKDANEEIASGIGSRFFENRRNGVLVRDRKVYTNNQIKGHLPDNWNTEKYNISIFNSSEDEFVAIGDVFEEKALFKTQEEGIISIIENYASNSLIHFYLRLHPNLSKVTYNYHKRLLSLGSRFDNVTVIPGDSSVSSYDLLDASDKVIAFGSTMGVESTFWGKPVLLLAGSFYYHLDVAYKPGSVKELFSLINDFSLRAKSKKEALKYGYYMMNYESYTIPNKYQPEAIKIMGINFGFKHRYLKYNGSVLAFKIIDKIYRIRARIKQKNSLSIPRRENHNN